MKTTKMSKTRSTAGTIQSRKEKERKGNCTYNTKKISFREDFMQGAWANFNRKYNLVSPSPIFFQKK
jgi:hypothetical protein